MKNTSYILYSMLAAIATILIHEISHWIAGDSLGYKMVMTLNSVWPAKGYYDAEWHYTFISAVGPLITLCQTIFVFFLLNRKPSIYKYPFLAAPFFTELMSGLMNLRNPNDLGRISTTFHLGLFTLPIVFVAIHFLFLFLVSKRNNYEWKFNAITLGWVSLFTFIWVGVNQIEKIYLIR